MSENIQAVQVHSKSFNVATFLLRFVVCLSFLPHGIYKAIHGIGGIQATLVNHGIPDYVGYGVFLGQIVAPILILIGYYTRTAIVFVWGTLGVILWVGFYLKGGFFGADGIFGMGPKGTWNADIVWFYLIVTIAIFLLGTGKYAIKPSKSF